MPFLNSSPAYLSTRSAIDKEVMAEAVSLFTSRFGPGPYSELFSETQYRVHAGRELMWLAAVDQYGIRPKKTFSSFDDPLAYGGFSLSVKYICSMFVDWFAAHRIFMDRAMAALPGEKLSGDHTFWVRPPINIISHRVSYIYPDCQPYREAERRTSSHCIIQCYKRV
jgi:hypothetical protein